MDAENAPSARSSWIDLALAAVAFVVVFAVTLPVARQGFSFLDDGVWTVGADLVLHGGVLYRDVFTIYGPGKFTVLAAFFALFGTSGATMALLESVALGVAAGAGTFAARRLGAGWIALAVPLAVLGLGVLKLKVVWAAVMTLLWGVGLRRGLDPRTGVLLGIGWGTVTWFGLDAALHAVVVAIGSLGLLAIAGRRVRARGPFGAAFGVTLLVPFVWALATGSLDDFVWAAFVYPLVHFRAEMSVPLLDTLASTETLGQPFATLPTGETLEAQWPRHELVRAWALRVLCAVVFLTPVVSIVGALRRSRDPLLLVLGLFGASSLLSLVTRGDEQHLMGAALASAWLLAVAIARTPRWLGAGAAVVGFVAFGPLLAENVWLATHTDREGTAVWDRDRAGVVLTEERIRSLEDNFGELADEGRIPTVFWPYQPGMNFVFDLPLGTPQITLLGGEVRDTNALIDQLQADPPRRMVVLLRFEIEDRGMRQLAPDLWHFVRTNYRVEDSVVGAEDPAWVLRPVYEGWPVVRELPLTKRLPDRFQSTADAWSPRLTSETRVAQTFRVGDTDLTGLQVRWLTLQPNLTIPVEMVLWSVVDGRLVSPLKGLRSEVTFDAPQKSSLFSFDPVPGTRGQQVAVELRIPPEVQVPVHLMWHDHSGEDETDNYPEGTALVNGEPTTADLYFATY